MSDPLSIAAGVVGLLQVTYAVAAELKKFHEGVTVVDDTIRTLQQEVDTLNEVLESARATFEAITTDNGCGLVASHWKNVAQLIAHCKDVVAQFCAELQVISKTHGFLDASRKQMRLRGAEDKIARFRVVIQSFRGSLSVSLQSIMLWNQVTLQRTMEQAFPNLFELQQDVRRIALQLKDLQDNRAMEEPEQIRVIGEMQECVKTAASIITSATTIAESVGKHDAGKSDCGTFAANSDFNDCFPATQEKLLLHRYMISRPSYEDRIAEFETPAYFAKQHAQDLPDEASDSETEIELAIADTLFKSAKEHAQLGDSSSAEKKLRSCLRRLSGHSLGVGNSQTKTYPMKLKAMCELVEIYQLQQRWADSKEILLAKIGLEEQFGSGESSDTLQDILLLARVLRKAGSSAEALLYARRALKGYKKCSDEGMTAACLGLLADIQRDEESEEENLTADGSSNKTAPATRQPEVDCQEHLPLSPPETPGDHDAPPSPARPSLPRQPVFGRGRTPPTTPPESESSKPLPEIIVTPSPVEKCDPMLTLIDTQTSLLSESLRLSPASTRQRRFSDESTLDADDELSGRSGDETDKSARTSSRLSLASSFRTRSPKAKGPQRIRVAIVGDTVAAGEAVFRKFVNCEGRKGSNLEINVDGKNVELELSGMMIDEDRPPTVILGCFNIGSPMSLRNVQNKITETLRTFPGTTILLVGDQPELREDITTWQSLARDFQHPVTRLEAEDVLKKTGACMYWECSTVTGEGVQVVIEQAARAGMMRMKKSRSRWKLF